MSRTTFAAAVLLVSLIASGCTSSEDPVSTVTDLPTVAASDEVADTPTTPAATSEPAEPEPTETEEPEPQPDPEPTHWSDILGPEYSTDSDGNLVPDFIEEELGFDPLTDECLLDDCGLDISGLLEADGPPPAATMLILDASGSMAGADRGGQSKIESARTAISTFITNADERDQHGLVVYGHQGDNTDAGRAASCAGIETFAPLGQLDAATVDTTLAEFQPTGWTPIAASIEHAAAELSATELDGAIPNVLLVTDGLETCDGDPVAAATALNETGAGLVVNVVGFDVAEGDAAALRAIAEASGGTYADAGNTDELNAALASLSQRRSDLAAALGCLRTAIANQRFCVSTEMSRSALFLLSLSNDASGDTRFALRDLREEILFLRMERLDEIANVVRPKIDELQAEFNELRKRNPGLLSKHRPSLLKDCVFMDADGNFTDSNGDAIAPEHEQE